MSQAWALGLVMSFGRGLELEGVAGEHVRALEKVMSFGRRLELEGVAGEPSWALEPHSGIFTKPHFMRISEA